MDSPKRVKERKMRKSLLGAIEDMFKVERSDIHLIWGYSIHKEGRKSLCPLVDEPWQTHLKSHLHFSLTPYMLTLLPTMPIT